jgi:pilus assembly protein CpaE
VRSGGVQEAINFLSDHETPQVLIVETTETGDALFQALEGLAEVCAPDSRVVLVGNENDVSLYRRLISMGLSEYFCGTVTAEDLGTTIEGLFAEGGGIELGRTIAFIGARGGVGTSSIAANTAYALGTNLDENVILLDLDLAFGTLAMTFNLQQKQSIVDALAQPNRLDDVLMARFMLKFDNHLSVVPAPSSLTGNYGIQLESFEVLLKLVRQMVPFVIMDVPHTWQPWVHEILLDANDLVVVAYPDLANLRDTKNLVDTLSQQRGKSPTRLVFNRVGMSKKTELSSKDFKDNLRLEPDIVVPFDPAAFGTAMNNGQMIVQASKASKAVPQFNNLATLVSGRESEADKKKSGGFSLFKSG